METLRLDSRNTSPEYTLRGKEEQKRCKEDLHSHRFMFVDFFLVIFVLLLDMLGLAVSRCKGKVSCSRTCQQYFFLTRSSHLWDLHLALLCLL